MSLRWPLVLATVSRPAAKRASRVWLAVSSSSFVSVLRAIEQHKNYIWPVAVLGKNIGGGAGPLPFGRQQRLSEIEPIKNWGLGKIWGAVPPGPSLKPPLHMTLCYSSVHSCSFCLLYAFMSLYLLVVVFFCNCSSAHFYTPVCLGLMMMMILPKQC